MNRKMFWMIAIQIIIQLKNLVGWKLIKILYWRVRVVIKNITSYINLPKKEIKLKGEKKVTSPK